MAGGGDFKKVEGFTECGPNLSDLSKKLSNRVPRLDKNCSPSAFGELLHRLLCRTMSRGFSLYNRARVCPLLE